MLLFTHTQSCIQTHMVSVVCDASMKHLFSFTQASPSNRFRLPSTAELHGEICTHVVSQSGQAQSFPWCPHAPRPIESVKGSICAVRFTYNAHLSVFVIMCVSAWRTAALYSLQVCFPASLTSGGMGGWGRFHECFGFLRESEVWRWHARPCAIQTEQAAVNVMQQSNLSSHLSLCGWQILSEDEASARVICICNFYEGWGKLNCTLSLSH